MNNIAILLQALIQSVKEKGESNYEYIKDITINFSNLLSDFNLLIYSLMI